ncbi:MAG: endonuclease/exonuclease/phosphatase family protein [Bacteroidales bacterium]|nr:endonuclease/exonuclease/phosphatase family protein [Bacteroidales bacterium]
MNMKYRSFICLFAMSIVALSLFCGCGNSKKDVEIKYISYNIRYGTADDGDNSWDIRKPATKEMIEREQPDVFGLQEALVSQLEYIDKNFPSYRRVGVGRDDGKEEGEFMAVYYRNDMFKLLDSGNFWLSETPDSCSFGWDAACRRIVTWAKFRDLDSRKVFFVFNTHLDHVGAVAREQSILLIIRKIDEITKGKNVPVFLSGDFNSDVKSSIFDPLKASMKDSRAILPESEWITTYNNFGNGNDALIDYIFYKNAEVLDFKTLNGDYGKPYISDHYPVMATMKI